MWPFKKKPMEKPKKKETPHKSTTGIVDHTISSMINEPDRWRPWGEWSKDSTHKIGSYVLSKKDPEDEIRYERIIVYKSGHLDYRITPNKKNGDYYSEVEVVLSSEDKKRLKDAFCELTSIKVHGVIGDKDAEV